MAYLGIDFGTKRIGVAYSSEDGSMAFPLKIVAMGKGAAGDAAIREICAIARERGAQQIVVGESKNFNGEPNPVMKDIEVFAAALRAEGFEIMFEPEFMTSAAALKVGSASAPTSRSRHAGEMSEAMQKQLDASAAALILQSYLDRKKNTE